MHIYDLIGIGFGPSNIALAITLEEKRQEGYKVDSFFIEKQRGFAWHANMMLDNTHMQISFLKDLATLRNPSSHFTFINYLHQFREENFITIGQVGFYKHFSDRIIFKEIKRLLPVFKQFPDT